MKTPKTSVQYPHRAVICGEEQIVQGWRGGNLLTDKGEFVFRRLHKRQVESEWPGEIGRVPGNYPIESARILEVATLQSDGNGGWLLNARNLSTLSWLSAGCRLHGITSSEVLRVHKKEIQAVAWVEVIGSGSITAQLDTVLSDWKSNLGSNPASDLFTPLGKCVSGWFAGWSKPIWLAEFHPLNVNNWMQGLSEKLEAVELESAPPQISVAEMLKQGINPYTHGLENVPMPPAQTVTSGDAAGPIQPPDINDTFLWHVQQKILDNLDPKLRSAPVASQVFITFCRDKLTRAEMHRRNKNWSESTIKLRIKSLRVFLKKEFNGLTLEAFFVDRSIFAAAEKQLKDYRAKNVSPLSVAELHGADEAD